MTKPTMMSVIMMEEIVVGTSILICVQNVFAIAKMCIWLQMVFVMMRQIPLNVTIMGVTAV